MARYLLIEFENDAQADALRAQIDTATEKGKPFRVVGLFGRPSKWCTCPKPTGYIKDELVQGSKYGWWVHTVCKKARMGTHQCHNMLPIREVKGLPPEGMTFLINGLSIAEIPVQNIGVK